MSAKSSTPSLGLLQMSMSESMEANYAVARELARSAASQGADVICLPELFTSPYFCRETQDASIYIKGLRPKALWAESIPGETSRFLSELAKELSVVLVGGSFYEQAEDNFYNTSLIFETDGTLLGTYRKIHIPQDECFFEKDYFSEGDLGYLVCDTSVGRIGVLICYDQWFPEAARSLALMGAEIIFYPTAIATVAHLGEAEGNWQEAWENVQRGHAIANGVVVAASNRVGTEGDSDFWGGSFVIDAFGKTLARSDSTQGVLLQEVDLAHGKDVRDGWGFLRNRRPDTYGQLNK